ncbi:hypothetical protein [Flavobacterium aciduliphilum]|uniref:Tetratricopeptide repeat protein n=1 Tax=Flavobacterium aciduliphilum TaxID=1101402 RepID=A0A328YIX1_9FLAO|nr:hypothetical protein [Flavobacterium aciduliphilum]RAR74098.1 hypothetical protein CLV55_10226 [Flavobacterium aciduliphilum]
MKAIGILLFGLLFFQLTWSQNDSCKENQKQCNQYFNDKEYQKAYDAWLELKKTCAKSDESVVLLGAKILQYNVEASDASEKEKKVRDLLALFDLYDQYFPQNQNGNNEKRAMALHENKLGTPDEIFNYLNLAFKNQKNTFTNPRAIYLYFELYYNQFKAKGVSFADLMSKYSDIISLIEENSQKQVNQKSEYDRVRMGIEAWMQNVITCDDLNTYVNQNFTANQKNQQWLGAVANVLYTKCVHVPMFGTVAQAYYTLKATSKSAFYMATYKLKSANQEEAIKFFTESIELSDNKLEKANRSYTIASILALSDKAKAAEMIQNAIVNDPASGIYYVFLANLYDAAAQECASNDNEKKAIYKLASDTVLKAGEVEPRFKQTAKTSSDEYLKKVTFEGKTKPKSIKVGCWINQKVQF